MLRLLRFCPARVLVLLSGEAVVTASCFLLAAVLLFGTDVRFILSAEHGFAKLASATLLLLACLHLFDLYSIERIEVNAEALYRLFTAFGAGALVLAAFDLVMPSVRLLHNPAVSAGLMLSVVGVCSWRISYHWALQRAFLKDRVYVLGTGERAQRVAHTLRSRDIAVDIVAAGCTRGRGRR